MDLYPSTGEFPPHSTEEIELAKPKRRSPETFNPFPIAGSSAWMKNFDFVGTLDSSPYFCIPAALEYRESLGGESAIREYCFKLAREVGERTALILGSEILENEERTLGECCFTNVRLPLDLVILKEMWRRKESSNGDFAADPVALKIVGFWIKSWIARRSVEEFNTHFQTFFHDGAQWVRWSAQAYLDVSDFEWGAEVLKGLCARIMQGEMFV